MLIPSLPPPKCQTQLAEAELQLTPVGWAAQSGNNALHPVTVRSAEAMKLRRGEVWLGLWTLT